MQLGTVAAWLSAWRTGDSRVLRFADRAAALAGLGLGPADEVTPGSDGSGRGIMPE
jgi:hypothetical protein